jgi:16S rRNA (cytosine1402-N4)-methyltransferase
VSNRFAHEPVLLEESLSLLQPAPGALVVDATLGGGGHAEAILERTAPDGLLLGLDRDDEALAAAAARLGRFGSRVRLVRASFAELGAVLVAERIAEVDAVLFDLGVSSRQLDAPERGFRFSEDAASETLLDMRMDRREGPTAADLLAHARQAELARWFSQYGELPGSFRLARAIVERRGQAPLRTSADLVSVVREARIGGGRRHHPATLVFRRRIAVNDELGRSRPGSRPRPALRPGGRLAARLSHLGDRLVKRTPRAAERGCICDPQIPVCDLRPNAAAPRRPAPGDHAWRRRDPSQSPCSLCAPACRRAPRGPIMTATSPGSELSMSERRRPRRRPRGMGALLAGIVFAGLRSPPCASMGRSCATGAPRRCRKRSACSTSSAC